MNDNNLIHFKPGMSGNPNGRPKGASLKTQVQSIFIEMMSDTVKYGKQNLPFLTAYKLAFAKSAMDGTWASKILAEKLFNDNILEEIDKSLNKDIRQNEDFQSYRIVKRAHDVQQKIILSKQSKKYLMAGRRAGKTEANILMASDKVIKPYSNVLIICLTFETCLKLYWLPLVNLLEELGHNIESSSRTEGTISLDNGSTISLKGNNSVTDREKFRGANWDLVIIDEAQSQSALPYLINDIIEPTLIDKKGQLVLSGTGPRVKGTYWEMLWDDNSSALKVNWSLKDNPFIPDYEKVLENIKKDKGLTDESPLFQREYLGLCVYDTDAQVFRLSEQNYYTDDEFANWVANQPVSDIRFTAGLDYGYADSDAFIIICYSTSSPEKFVLYEYKQNRTGITELYNAVKKGMDMVTSNPLFNRSVSLNIGPFNEKTPDIDKFFYIFCDTNEQKISQEFRTQYNLPTTNAYKYDKDMAVELLQEEVRKGNLKIKKGSIFEGEANKTIWLRNDKDELTRKIDDVNFHPDMMDAMIYSLRYIWKYGDQPLI